MFKIVIFSMITVALLSADTFSLGGNKKVVASKTSPQTRVVITTGYGTDKELALKNAFKSAVEQYVGVVVDADTIVKNDKIIKDEILTASNGFIEKYKELSTEKIDGLIEVNIRAIVKSQKVFNAIKNLNITTIKLNGFEDEYAKGKKILSDKENEKVKVLTKTIAKEDAEKILRKEFNKFFSAKSIEEMLTTHIVDVKVKSENMDANDKVPVVVTFDLMFNHDVYTKKVAHLGQVLENLGAKFHAKVDFPYLEDKSLKSKLKRRVKKLRDTDIGIVSPYGEHYKLDVWEFPHDWGDIFPFYEASTMSLSYLIGLFLEIKKQNGDVIISEDINVNNVNNGKRMRYILKSNVSSESYISGFTSKSAKIITPTFFYSNGVYLKRKKKIIFKQVFKLNLDEIKDLGAVTVGIEKK